MRGLIFNSILNISRTISALALVLLVVGCGRNPNSRDDASPLIAAGKVSGAPHSTRIIDGPGAVEIPEDYKKDWETRYQPALEEIVTVSVETPPESKSKESKVKRLRVLKIGQQTFTESPVKDRAPIRNYLPLKVQTPETAAPKPKEQSTQTVPVTPAASTPTPAPTALPEGPQPLPQPTLPPDQQKSPVPVSKNDSIIPKPVRTHDAIWVKIFPISKSHHTDAYKQTVKLDSAVLKAIGGELIIARLSDGVAIASAKKISFSLKLKKMIIDDKYSLPLAAYHIVPGVSTVIEVCGDGRCHAYRGTFVVSYETQKTHGACSDESSVSSPHIRVMNVVDLEDYLFGVVPAEMGSAGKDEKYAMFGDEALKAQSVAARTYATYKVLIRKNWKSNSDAPLTGCADVKPTTDDQQYLGYEIETIRATRAIQATAGRLVYYQGKVIQANFHGNSGGQTKSIKHWGRGRPEAEFPYLVPVNEYDVTAVRSGIGGTRKRELKPQIIISTLRNLRISFSDQSITRVVVKDRNSSSEVTALEIAGPTSSVILAGKNLLAFYAHTNIKINDSDYFDVKIQPTGIVTFYLYGNGHRVGLSQVGAAVLAKAGKRYSDILHFYYGSSVNIR
ncbi:MAG: SpoIID/LytB domain-containing protein [Oligoflexia bacterium]|nr:SpoIID/LytB domain-containing protein [Oligoflexia bacterium]